MDELAANVPAGANGLLFYPYLQGAGPDTPGACGVFAGLFGSADRASMWRAILEAIAFEYAQMIKIYRECGIPLDEIIGTEGGSKSPLWTQIKADILRGAYNIPARSEGGLMADAAVAAYAVGDISDIRETMRARREERREIRKNIRRAPEAARGADARALQGYGKDTRNMTRAETPRKNPNMARRSVNDGTTRVY